MTATIERTEEGFARMAAGPSVGARVRSARWFLVIAGTLAVVVIIALLNRTDRDTLPLSINSYEESGARALAEVARDQGLSIGQIDTLGAARITDPAATTVVIANGFFLQPYQARTILAYPGPVLVIGDAPAVFDEFDSSVEMTFEPAGVRGARCPDPDAQAADTIAASGVSVVAPDADVTCFVGEEGASMVVFEREGRADITFLADGDLATNADIDNQGNAALMLRLIGHEPRAVWYLGNLYDTSTLFWTDENGTSGSGGAPPDVPASTDFLPPGTGNAIYALAFALVVAALWKARRFGALVTEPLPVIIRSSEATKGRARLYRAAKATGRAAAALRASAALRMARRLGLGRSASRAAIVAAIAQGTRRPAAEVEELLYGPPPTSESAMMRLIDQIDHLESEVHRT